jgi:hypothetical protein
MSRFAERLEDRCLCSAVHALDLRAAASIRSGTIASDGASSAIEASAAPTNLGVQSYELTEAVLNWTDNSAGTASVNVFRATGSGAFQLIATVGPAPTAGSNYIDNGLALGVTYTYKVQSFIAANGTTATSGFSKVVTLTAGSSGPPDEFTATIGDSAAKTFEFREPGRTRVKVVWKGPGFATLSLNGSNLSQSMKRGIATIKQPTYINYFIAKGTTSATSITISANGGTDYLASIAYISIGGSLGQFIAPTTQVYRIFTVNGNIGTFTLGQASGELDAGYVQRAHIDWFKDAEAHFDAIGTFLSSVLDNCYLDVAGNMSRMTVNGDFIRSNVKAAVVGDMKLGAITGPIASTMRIIIASAKSISGDLFSTRFKLQNVTSGSNIPALLAAQKVTEGPFYIETE